MEGTMAGAHALGYDQITTLYRHHHAWLCGWLHARVRSRQDADEIAQDTFVRIIEKRDALYVDEAKALLTTIAKGLLIDHFRRAALARAYVAALEAMPPAHAPSPEAQALVLETLVAVDRLLRRLPAKVREVFLMAQLDGLAYADIAAQRGVSIRTVQHYMTQAWRLCYDAA
jgi:RNA polymerase sigma-70 factor (ECF subfamily)